MNLIRTFDNGTLAEARGNRRTAFLKLSEAASRTGKSFTDFGEALKLLKKSRLPRKLKKKLKKQQSAFGESKLMKFAEVYGKIGHLPCFDMTYEEAMKATTNDLPKLL